MAKVEVRIPAVMGDKQIDYSIDSGDIKKWHKKVGDRVRKGETLLDFDISKAVIEAPSPVSGVLIEILVPLGPSNKDYPDGTPRTISTKRWEKNQRFIAKVVAVIETDEAEESLPKKEAMVPPVLPQEKGEVSNKATGEETKPKLLISPLARKEIEVVAKILGLSPVELTEKLAKMHLNVRLTREHVQEFAKTATAPQQISPSEVVEEEHPKEQQRVRVLIPLNVRRTARELGVSEEELRTIAGTGQDGAITAGDVENYARTRKNTPGTPSSQDETSASQTPKNNEEGKPFDATQGKPKFKVIRQPSIRRAIARNLETAWEDKPLAQGTFRCNMTRLLLFKRNYGKAFEECYGTKLQLALPLVAALVRMLANPEFTYFNSMWAYEKDEEEDLEIGIIRAYEEVNLGVSFDTPKGLVVLTVRNSDKLSIGELAQKLVALGEKAQNGTYTFEDQMGETFIFNNIGGLRLFVPEDLKDEEDRFEIIHESGFSLLTPPVSLELNLGGIDGEGKARMQVCFDHRPIDGGGATRLAYAVYSEMFRIIRELEGDLRKKL